ncbi:hypothetical protein Fot_19601 [Forsythia ovata]|uniref:Uncharacterized protein n=1 Tax=Forsythia ovata TaxID=205694 RepID=A0ABD1VLI3_9LAMI
MEEINTVQSHVLNFELYKVLVGYEESKIVGFEDADELRSKNKVFFSKLDLAEEARRQTEYKVLKVQSIQKVAEDARRRAEQKLKMYKDMAYTRHKKLAEAMAELSKANEILARLGAHTCADPKEATGPYDLYFM